jgi:hypothetical protein
VILPDVLATIRAQLAAAAGEADAVTNGVFGDTLVMVQKAGNGTIAHNIVANSLLTQSHSTAEYLAAAPGLEHWLTELEGLVQAEAWDAAHAKIQAMKRSLVTSAE